MTSTAPLAGVPDIVKAKILRATAAATYPRQALGDIASRYDLTLDQVRAVVEKHGWPRPASMNRAAEILEQRHADQQMTERLRAETQTDGDVLVDVPLGNVHPDPENPRSELLDLDELAESIAQVGLVQPVVVRRVASRLVLIAGHRRVAAARRLEWSTIPAIIRAGNVEDVLAKMLAENGQRLGLDPVDEARAMATLKEREALTDAQLGTRIGRSQFYVSGRLSLLGLSPTEQARVSAGLLGITAGSARGRKLAGRHREGAQGKKSAAHLTSHHPLGALVEEHCANQGHSKNTPGRVGGIACGQCWEAIIRADERRLAARSDRPDPRGADQ